MKWKNFDRQFTVFRQVITYGLGVWAVIYAITTSGKNYGYILGGFVLIGLIPVERFFEGVILVRQQVPKPKPEPAAPPVNKEALDA
jgi:hypothetical protein